MSFSVSSKDVRTPEWAQEVMEYLDMSEEESSKLEEEEDLVPAPFKVRIINSKIRSLDDEPRGLEAEIKRPARQRIVGIRRKTLVEIKTLVLEKMFEEEPGIQKEMDRTASRVIFLDKDGVTVLRPHQFQYKYFELTDLQYNLFMIRVKEETDKDRLEVDRHKADLLRQLNQQQQAEEGTTLLIA